MYYAQSQHPDLIILDDPISSFDSNKKYAILHRMFRNIGKRDVSLVGSTVLLLTHDFEPITDFIIVGKLSEEQAVSSFIWNEDGLISVGNETFVDMDTEEIHMGMEKIQEDISDFDYDDLKINVYNVNGIKKLYATETNAYLKVQLFRAMCEVEYKVVKINFISTRRADLIS